MDATENSIPSEGIARAGLPRWRCAQGHCVDCGSPGGRKEIGGWIRGKACTGGAGHGKPAGPYGGFGFDSQWRKKSLECFEQTVT